LILDSKVRLNDGVEIPRLGLGVYQLPAGETTFRIVKYALNIGYKHIDTARLYGNEADVGRAVKESGIQREEIFITTKVWNSDQGYDMTIKAFEGSLRRLGLSYVDLYLIHWPVQGKLIETWKAMIKILKDGRSRTIGVSNYSIDELQKTIQTSDVVPAINQIEFHPFLYREDILHFCNNNKIQIEAYSPLTRGKKLNHPTLKKIAKEYGKTSAQLLIRWSLQHGLVVIPKSIQQNRIFENSQIFDFEIDAEDMTLLNSLNENFHTVFLD
jgi:diketogulonate reductase-like aldo/keto reductase